MRALSMSGHGDLSQLAVGEVPTPDLVHPLDVRVAVQAAALNHLDLHTLKGLPGLSLKFPHVLCGDGAGVVDAVGAEVRRVKVGDRVMINPGISCGHCDYCLAGEQSHCTRYQVLGEHLPGTLAEFAIIPESNVVAIPEVPSGVAPISWEEAAAFSLVTLTAWRMVVTRAQVRPGEVVLIWGIGGGVSSTALLIAKLMGACVIATSSQDEKLSRAREMGADLIVNHRDADVGKLVRKFTGKRGADVVIDNVGEATWETSLRALRKGGRLVTCGGTSGPMVVTDVRRLFWNQYTIMGSTMGNDDEYREIIRVLGQGHLRPIIDSVRPLDQAVEAFRRLQSGDQFGKLVIRVT